MTNADDDVRAAERLLDAFATGAMSRREAALGLLALGLASVTGGRAFGAAGEPTFRTTGLNHLGLRVSDVARSRDFYRDHLGLTLIRDNSPGNCFLRAGEHYMGLFRSSSPAVDHFCLTVEGYDADDAMSKIERLGLTPRREEDRVYLDDPDGLEVQLDSRYGSWPGTPPSDS